MRTNATSSIPAPDVGTFRASAWRRWVTGWRDYSAQDRMYVLVDQVRPIFESTCGHIGQLKSVVAVRLLVELLEPD